MAELIQFRQHLDADSVGDQVNRENQWIQRQIEKWLHSKDAEQLEDGFYQSPRKSMDLERMADRVSLELLGAESMGAPPDRLEYFELFLEELAVLIEQKQLADKTSVSTTIDASQAFPSLGGSSNGSIGQGIPGGGAPGLGGGGAGGALPPGI